jgi:hypothetical protein
MTVLQDHWKEIEEFKSILQFLRLHTIGLLIFKNLNPLEPNQTNPLFTGLAWTEFHEKMLKKPNQTDYFKLVRIIFLSK